ncbi:hypothetical protein N1I86_05405 [Bacillus sp. FSL W8-0116]|uniref:hypothetical protein n=1 Tax=Bacillus sp. FSL W8-0116 TaxID=2978206 RepID=UPI0030FCB458
MEMENKVENLKEVFLESSFIDSSVKELEDIRFRLLEMGIHLEISIKKDLSENVLTEIKKHN